MGEVRAHDGPDPKKAKLLTNGHNHLQQNNLLQNMKPDSNMLVFEDNEHRAVTLTCLNTLRKSGQFCDVTLEVGPHELLAHKAVLAAASGYLLDLFSLEENTSRTHFKLNHVDFRTFHILVDYIYTSRLEVPVEHVKAVYKSAIRLKMPRAAQACSEFLAQNLSPVNCIGIRACSTGDLNTSLMRNCDEYIHRNIHEIAVSKECTALPRIQVEIVGAASLHLDETNEKQIYRLVVDWVKDTVNGVDDLDAITDHVNVVYLGADCMLHDCVNIDDITVNSTEYVQDYKKLSKKRQMTPSKSKEKLKDQPSSSIVARKLQLEGDIEEIPVEDEWKVIASEKSIEKDGHSFCVCILHNKLVTISIHIRPTPHITNGNSDVNGHTLSPCGSPKLKSVKNVFDPERQMSLVLLAPMSNGRSGLGVAVMDEKIITMGGYERGECFRSVEQYDPKKNKWTELPDMREMRARFDAAEHNGCLYACGGSDGFTELSSIEYFDGKVQMWSPLPNMKQSRASTGIAILNDKLYCIGGSSGQGGMKSCEVLDLKEGVWSEIAHTRSRRSEAGVCCLADCVYAVGGCDSWNCLNTVERYDPDEPDRWTMVSHMKSCRRGAGVAAFDDKIYVVGGSDGSSAQNTVEIYDPKKDAWSYGPSMGIPRVNVAVAVVGRRLYALGGFNGKVFLDTIEYLDLDVGEWSSYVPTEFV
ncbi:influenza virus NS1A-binding protein homolog isoform X2 [Lineus longissimus]